MIPVPTKAPAGRAATKPASRKSVAKPSAQVALGVLPGGNLAELYPGIASPEVRRDLERAEADCASFEQDFKGRLGGLATSAGAGQALAEALRRYEAIEDRIGRLMSYAGLVYAGDTTDPIRAKFYGDMQERITTASTHLLFFTLELNRIDDEVLNRAMDD